MTNKSSSPLQLLFGRALLLIVPDGAARATRDADCCPTAADAIAANQPAATNSCQMEWTVRHRSNELRGTTAPLSYAAANRAEFTIGFWITSARLNALARLAFFKRYKQLRIPEEAHDTLENSRHLHQHRR